MAFDYHTDIIGIDGGLRGSFRSAESAHEHLSRACTMRLVWA